MRFLAVLMILFPSIVLAHGEEKPGPHNGHIRMPGAFHTELILGSDQSAHVYLLDMNFKNPTTTNSKIEIYAKNKKNKVAFTCSIMDTDHFHCVPEKKYPMKGDLVVKAVRDNAPGNEISYKLPLSTFKSEPKKEKDDPNHHHH